MACEMETVLPSLVLVMAMPILGFPLVRVIEVDGARVCSTVATSPSVMGVGLDCRCLYRGGKRRGAAGSRGKCETGGSVQSKWRRRHAHYQVLEIIQGGECVANLYRQRLPVGGDLTGWQGDVIGLQHAFDLASL